MDKSALLAARRRSRERKVELEEGKAVTIVRPPEGDFASMLTGEGDKRTWNIDLDHVRRYTVGWDGILESDFLGAGVGGSDPVPFDADLWLDLAADNVVWMRKCTDAIFDSVVEYFDKKAAVAKNSEPDSTSPPAP